MIIAVGNVWVSELYSLLINADSSKVITPHRDVYEEMNITKRGLERHGSPHRSFKIKSSFINPTRETFTGW